MMPPMRSVGDLRKSFQKITKNCKNCHHFYRSLVGWNLRENLRENYCLGELMDKKTFEKQVDGLSGADWMGRIRLI